MCKKKSSTFIAKKDMHFTKERCKQYKRSVGETIEHFRSDARGISIFFVKNKEFNIHKKVIAEGGHLIINGYRGSYVSAHILLNLF